MGNKNKICVSLTIGLVERGCVLLVLFGTLVVPVMVRHRLLGLIVSTVLPVLSTAASTILLTRSCARLSVLVFVRSAHIPNQHLTVVLLPDLADSRGDGCSSSGHRGRRWCSTVRRGGQQRHRGDRHKGYHNEIHLGEAEEKRRE